MSFIKSIDITFLFNISASESADDTKENISGIAEGLLDGVESGALWICLICGHVGCGR